MATGMRRPPRLWEQKLEQMIRGVSRGATAASTGNADQGVPPGPGAPGDEPGEDTPVVDPDPTTPRLPATPSVASAIGGLSILWTGLDADGDPFPARTRVQVHVSTSTGFTPDGTTLRGTIAAGERIVVTDLTSGTTYYVVFVLVAPDGTVGDASAEASLAAGFVLETNIGTGEITADLVSFDASAIGGIQQFVGTTTPAVTGAGTPAQQPKDGSTWINTSNNSYYTLTSGSWVQRQWGSSAISAGAISTTQLAAGAITASSGIIANGAIGNAQIATAAITDAKIQDATITSAKISSLSAAKITTGTMSGDRITGGTIQGSTIVTRADGYRIRLKDGGAGGTDHLEFLSGSTVRGRMFATDLQVGIECPQNMTIYNVGAGLGNLTVGDIGCSEVDTSVLYAGEISSQVAFRVGSGGDVYSNGIDGNTTASAANVRCGASAQLLKLQSTVRVKEDLQPVSGVLVGVEPSKISTEAASVGWLDVLDVCPTEFRSLAAADNAERLFGFIAEDVAEKFPWAAEWDDEGKPSTVNDRPILAALLAVVQDQAATISDLTARLDALEAN